jgi:hypothetical protein
VWVRRQSVRSVARLIELAALASNHHGLPLRRADRNRLVTVFLVACPTWADRRIATAVGVSASTVGAARRRMFPRAATDAGVQSGQVEHREGSDGKLYPVKRRPEVLEPACSERLAPTPTPGGLLRRVTHAVRRAAQLLVTRVRRSVFRKSEASGSAEPSLSEGCRLSGGMAAPEASPGPIASTAS